VRSVDDVGDLDAGLVRTRSPVVRRVDEETQVVEQRTLDLGGIALVQLEERAGHLDPWHAVARLRRREAERQPFSRRPLGIGRNEGDVVEVVVDIGLPFDEPDVQPLAGVDLRPGAVGERSHRLLQVRDAQSDAAQCPRCSWPVGLEQRQLSAPRVAAHERETIGPLDHVHAEVRAREVRDRIAVGDPEGDVVQTLRLHAEEISFRGCPGSYAGTTALKRIFPVGASTPPARSTVTATVEPAGTRGWSGTLTGPPPPNNPARWGALPFGITQAS